MVEEKVEEKDIGIESEEEVKAPSIEPEVVEPEGDELEKEDIDIPKEPEE